MDKAKAAISDFLHKDGKHSTTVHETVSPAIQQEHVIPTTHENVTTAVDREVHQDHFHTSVQPVRDQEVLPEQHTHNLGAVDHREIHHGNDEHIKQRLEAERAQFKDTREVGETQQTQDTAPTVAGEHIHHHIHEMIQPVVQKETIQPSVVHTTVPIHEVHHNEAKHHSASALPAVSMADFKNSGGVLTGREERTDTFEGEPRAVGSTLSGDGNHILGGRGAKGDTSLTERDGVNGSNGAAVGDRNEFDENYDGANVDGTTKKKASLIDKINPKVDSDGDGKAGFMK